MNVFEIVMQTLKITYRRDFVKSVWYLALPGILITLGALIAVVPAASIAAAQRQGLALGNIAALFIIGLSAIIGITILCKGFWDGVLAYLVITFMTKNARDDEKILPKKEYLKLLDGRKGRYALLLLVVTGIVLIPVFFLFFALFAARISALHTAAAASALIGFIGLLFASIKLCFAYQVFAFKPALKCKEIITKSYSLTNGYFWQTIGLLLLIQIPPQFLSFTAALVPNEMITKGIAAAIMILYAPVYITAMTLWYFEIKRRKNV